MAFFSLNGLMENFLGLMQENFQMIQKKELKKILEEGRGFKLNDQFKKKKVVQILILQVQMNYGELLLM